MPGGSQERTPVVRSYVAIGDSFTEGLDDPGPDGEYRGFADRLAEHLSSQTTGFRYANLAVRGRRIRHIFGEQLEQTLEFAPDLVTVHAAGNDVLRPNTNLDRLAVEFDRGVQRLCEAGITVVLLSGHDTGWIPVLRAYRGRVAVFSMHLRTIGEHHGCHVVDLWAIRALNDPRAWSVDRLHLNAAGHRILTARIAESIGQPVGGPELWQRPFATPPEVLPPAVRRRETYRWTRKYLVPWLRRRAMGRSSGDGLMPKRPVMSPFVALSPPSEQEAQSPNGQRPLNGEVKRSLDGVLPDTQYPSSRRDLSN